MRRPARYSQAEKILWVLEDGRWHSTYELLPSHPNVVPERVKELRKLGWEIERDDYHRYRLTSPRPSSRPTEASPPRWAAAFVCTVDESAGMEEWWAQNDQWSVRA